MALEGPAPTVAIIRSPPDGKAAVVQRAWCTVCAADGLAGNGHADTTSHLADSDCRLRLRGGWVWSSTLGVAGDTAGEGAGAWGGGGYVCRQEMVAGISY